MQSSDYSNHPAFQNLSPEKLELLMQFATGNKPNTPTEMMSYLMGFRKKAQDKGITFEEQESNFIIEQLTASMNPADRQKAQMILQMIKRRR